MTRHDFPRLQKQLTLLDVYVVSCGAMIGSGFFLLPGVATAYTGASVIVAYLLAGVLVIPALLSQAELATAMPRAGGPYYFLDRTLGPVVGTIGGVGHWLALVLKSAFVLIGIGAYAALVVDLPVIPTALAFTVVFAVLNIVGLRESATALRLLVGSLLVALAAFVLFGLTQVLGSGAGAPELGTRLTPFFAHGVDGVLGAVGIVFVAFIGLTKLASLAEEVRDPDRNIPLGLGAAVVTVTVLFALGMVVMVGALGPDRLAGSLTPAAASAAALVEWLPSGVVVGVMVAVAVTAFAASANAGILAASRYPLAMARDRLFPAALARTSRRDTPTLSILLTCGLLCLVLVALQVEQVAKLASALQLLLFGLINVAVIVMRESHIESYDPGFRSPLYPWMQLAGLFVPLVLVAEMGWLPVLFTLGVVAACFAWYNSYARRHTAREGALYHVFERLGRRRFQGLERELRIIMKEKGARAEDPFDEVVADAFALDLHGRVELDGLIREASARLAPRLPVTAQQLESAFRDAVRAGAAPAAHGAALFHTRLPSYAGSVLGLARCHDGVRVSAAVPDLAQAAAATPIRALFFLVSGTADPGQHLRILAQLAGRIEDEAFLSRWLASRHEQDLKETLLRDERFLSLRVAAGTASEPLMGLALRDIRLPEGSLVALIRRGGQSIVPRGSTVLLDGDRLTVIGEPEGLRAIAQQYGDGRAG